MRITIQSRPTLRVSIIFFIFLILELNAGPTEVQKQQIKNIRKVFSVIRNYQRSYDFYRRNELWNRDRNSADKPDGWYYDVGYIEAQVLDGTNLTDLQTIFILQILAMIYACKLEKRFSQLPKETKRDFSFYIKETEIYVYLARYGTMKSVSAAIMEILMEKYRKSCEEFEQISIIFEKFQKQVDHYIIPPTEEYQKKNPNYERELQETAGKLIEYIRTAFLEFEIDEPESGLGIDADTEKIGNIDTDSLTKIMNQNPNELYYNTDTEKDMYRSRAASLLNNLIMKIALSFDRAVRQAIIDPPTSVFLVQPKSPGSAKLVFIEITDEDLQELFPEASDP